MGKNSPLFRMSLTRNTTGRAPPLTSSSPFHRSFAMSSSCYIYYTRKHICTCFSKKILQQQVHLPILLYLLQLYLFFHRCQWQNGKLQVIQGILLRDLWSEIIFYDCLRLKIEDSSSKWIQAVIDFSGRSSPRGQKVFFLQS